MSDIVKRRMDSSVNYAIEKAKEVQREEGITLPPQVVGQMALAMFEARMSMLFQTGGGWDLPEDSGEGFQ